MDRLGGYIGVDLGCSARTKTPSSAVAVLDERGRLLGTPRHFRTADELVNEIRGYDWSEVILAVDAPRSVPDHRVEDYARRSCERELRSELGEYVGAFSGVASLYVRWYEIETQHLQGLKVIETYPRFVWPRAGLSGSPKEFRKVREDVWATLGTLVGGSCDGFSHHQVDAVLCAYTAWCYARGEVDWYGQAGGGLLILPAPGRSQRPAPDEERIDDRFRRFPCMCR